MKSSASEPGLRGNPSAINLKLKLELNFNLPDVNATIFLVVVKLVWF